VTPIAAILIVAIVAVMALLAGDRILKAWALERTEWARERADLLQRIQAPREAVLEHQLRDVDTSPPAVGIEDDDGYWESKDELAARAWAQEVNGGRDG
jgi:hypothetical protein